MTWHVYDLIDPRTGETRYVGCTVSPRSRLSGHISGHKSKAKAAWFADMNAAGVPPTIKVVSSHTTLEEGEGAESARISLLTREGKRLVNRKGVPPPPAKAPFLWPGNEAFAKWCTWTELSDKEIAAVIGDTSVSQVALWRTAGVPSLDVAIRIEAVSCCTVKASDWYSSRSAKAILDACARAVAVGIRLPATKGTAIPDLEVPALACGTGPVRSAAGGG